MKLKSFRPIELQTSCLNLPNMLQKKGIKLLLQALEALQFKNVVNMCGKYSVVDPVKAAEAIIALRKRLEEKA